MNILIVCHYGLYQDLSFSFVHNQVREYQKLGHNVRVVVPNGLGKLGRDGKRIGKALCISCVDGVALYDLRYLTASRYGQKGFNTYSAIGAIRVHWKQIFSDFVPDIIHAHTLGFDSEIGAWLKERLHVPLVVTTHGSDTSVPVEQGRAGELKPFCDKADRLIAISSALANKLRSCRTQTPISVILNGFQSHLIPEGPVKKAPLSLIQVGHLQKQKRVHMTIRAFAALQKRYPEATLTVIGQGEERNRLEALCRELGVENAVCFLGQIPNEAVLAEMAKSRFFVLPSVREGFGIVYLEAMANGCITIGTEGEGISDLIVSGENGFLVPPDDPDAIVQTIVWCLEHPDESSAIAERGRMDAADLTWENNAAQYLDLFRLLTEEERHA